MAARMPPLAEEAVPPILPNVHSFIQALGRISFSNAQIEELIINQAIYTLEELGLLSSTDITDIGKAIVTQGGERIPITKLKKLKIIIFLYKTRMRMGLTPEPIHINNALIAEEGEKYDLKTENKSSTETATVHIG